MSDDKDSIQIATVTLNPAIDRTVSIPEFALGKVNRVDSVHDRPGGKGVNVAAALADYGCGVAVSGFLGGSNAALFERMFTDKGITDAFVRVPGETRTGIKVADPVAKRTTDINFPGLSPAAGALTELERTLRRVIGGGCRWVVLSGSLPPGVSANLYGDLVTLVRDCGARSVLDTSGEALRYGVAARPDVVKPNTQELSELTGRPLPDVEAVAEAARGPVAAGVGLVVVSMGGDGALFVTVDSALQVVPPAVEVVSTVGAGDAMVAGLLAGMIQKLPLEDSARLAAAFAQDRVTHLDAGLQSRQSVDDWVDAMVVRHLD